MRSCSHIRRLIDCALALLIAFTLAGVAQAAGGSGAISSQKVELLFVQNSTGMKYDPAAGTLRLQNVARSTLFFTDRPVRMAGHYHTRQEFLPLWSEGPDSFAKNPPNATLSMLEVGNPDLQNVVMKLRNPRMEGNDLLYDITVLEGKLPRSAEGSVLFIDVLGFWRRRVRRVAIIGTAAATTTAAAAASASAASAAAAEAAAKPPPSAPVQAAAPAAPAPQSADAKKLEQLKSLRKEGLITEAQYQKASQEVLNELVK